MGYGILCFAGYLIIWFIIWGVRTRSAAAEGVLMEDLNAKSWHGFIVGMFWPFVAAYVVVGSFVLVSAEILRGSK